MGVEAVVDEHTEVSVRARIVFAAARLMLRPVLTYWPLTTWGLRPLFLLESAAGLLPAPCGVRVERVDFGGFAGEWVRPDPTEETALSASADGAPGVVLYLHGGAFVTCGVATHRYEVALIAQASGLPVLSVGYRQLPTVRLAGSVDDCLSVYRGLLAEGFDPSRIVIAGDSAGGNLAFATALAARAEGLPGPAGIVALSPWLDFDATAKLAHPNAGRDAYAPVSRLPELARLLGADQTPDPSPVHSDLTGLPPVLLVASESEMLRCDAELMAERLAAADVPVALQIWAGQVHAFPVLGNLLPESKAAIREIATFIRDLVHPAAIEDRPDVTALAG
ncbi:MAG TPA: alpha/beta hydrolase [Pseudonocardiaceae bacterium]|nr:alpha/beta hydrolase [Pseudonocardiaceae bacterium]